MSAFTDWPGRMIRMPGTDSYTATHDLPWRVGHESGPPIPPVPASFPHDVSVPFGLGWLQDRHDPQVQKFARLHDWLLHLGWSRVEAGATAHQALVADGVGRWKRMRLLLAVTLWKYR